MIVLALCYDGACIGDAMVGKKNASKPLKTLMQNINCQFLTPTSTNIGGYRYFFNGQEGDNEVFGEVANFGYEFRQYDSRLGRWWSVDPKWNEYPGVSPYAFCGGNPIIIRDINGGYGVIVIKQQCVVCNLCVCCRKNAAQTNARSPKQ